MLYPVPPEEFFHLVVILADVRLLPYLEERVRPNSHPPHIFIVMDKHVLRKLGTWSVELIDESQLLGGLKFKHPFVEELTWQLVLILFICAVEVLSIHLKIKLTAVITLLYKLRDKYWSSESFVNDNCLVPGQR